MHQEGHPDPQAPGCFPPGRHTSSWQDPMRQANCLSSSFDVHCYREEAVVLREYLDQPDKKGFLEEFPQIKRKLEKSIKKLRECTDNVDKVHRDCTISNVVASSTNIASGILTILGLALEPFTAGISLGLSATGLGLGAAAAVTGVSTSIMELVNTSSVEAQLDFHSIAQKISSGKSLYEAKDFRKHIRAIRMAKSNPQLVAGQVCGRSTQPVRAAFGGTALAMTRRARICGGVSAGLFLPFNIWSLVKDSQDLQGRAKTESAERLREQAQKLEMNLEVLTHIYERLK
nr:apolipoprotein L3-like [Odocoileus virginianus texanus]